MKSVSRNELKRIVEQWKGAGTKLERRRREELRCWNYDWRAVDALLELGMRNKTARLFSGLVEQQKWFLKLAQQKS